MAYNDDLTKQCSLQQQNNNQKGKCWVFFAIKGLMDTQIITYVLTFT